MSARQKSKTFWCGFDFPGLEDELKELNKKSEDPVLWNDPENAKKIMRRLARVRERVVGWRQLKKSIADTRELAELGEADFRAELETETEAIEAEVYRRIHG